MTERIHAIHSYAARAGLKINDGKTMMMYINTTPNQNIDINGKVIKVVGSFMYLVRGYTTPKH